ncbi:MAG: hypothetical protein R3247_11905 [Rhodothermales bacterium]|nr:hypothetical protein [Rhodothermales bacterium]
MGIRFFLVSLLLAAGCAPRPAPQPAWTFEPVLTPQQSGTDALFIGVSVVDEAVVWLSGTGGTFARTLDGGATWQAGTVPGADSLQFRDVEAFDAQTAFLLSIGNGDQSRIYHTTDGGATWALRFTNAEPEAFFDCMDFWDARHGLAFSDSFDGAFRIIRTDDGGRTWAPIPSEDLPPATEGEGSFAASGTCLVTVGEAAAYVGTGAGAAARVLRTTDRGRTWTTHPTPIVGGTATSGIASLTFRDPQHGAALGGEIGAPNAFADNVAVTDDGGRTWRPGARTPFPGAVYGAAYVPGAPQPTLVAVGPGGAAVSTDDARSWAPLDSLTYWSAGFASPRAGWIVGPGGRVVKVSLYRRP